MVHSLYNLTLFAHNIPVKNSNFYSDVCDWVELIYIDRNWVILVRSENETCPKNEIRRDTTNAQHTANMLLLDEWPNIELYEGYLRSMVPGSSSI